MLKVALLLPSLARTGPIFVANKIVENLKHEVDFTVFYFDKIEDLPFDCKTVKIGFFEKFDFKDFDIVHSHMMRPDWYLIYHKVSSFSKTVTTFHQYIFDNLKYTHNAIISHVLTYLWLFKISKINHIVCLSNGMKEYYSNKKINKSISYISNGVNIPVINNEVNKEDIQKIKVLKSKYIVIGTMAKYDARKGLEQIIKVLAINPKLAFVLIGDGSEKENLLALANQLKVSDRIFFAGFRKNSTDYLPYFDIYIAPSRSEGVSLSLLEAVASKTPIVCSNIISFTELFDKDEISFFELDNIESLNDAITFSLENNSKLKEKAFEKYHNNYTETIMAQQYLKLYKNLLSKNTSN
ncbi:MAG: glycosyltransferase family 4 protein [Bacteroidia bacterium]